MIVVVLAAALFNVVCALPQTHSGPSPALSARQQVVTSADGVTKTVQQSSGSNKTATIAATVAVIVGFVALILVGIWIGSWRSKKNSEWRRTMMAAQQEAKKQHRLTTAGQRPGSAQMTPASSIASNAKVNRKSSGHSLTPSTSSSFVSSGVPMIVAPQPEQRRPPVLYQPSPRTPSSLVQSPLLHQQHSEYPPAPSFDRPDASASGSLPPPSPETNRTSLYAQQPARPSPLHNSVTLRPSVDIPLSESPPSFEPPARHIGQATDGPPPATRHPPSFQPPANRKSSGDINLTITVPPHHHDEGPNAPPGLENYAAASPHSMRSGEMGTAM